MQIYKNMRCILFVSLTTLYLKMISPFFILCLIIGYFLVLVGIAYAAINKLEWIKAGLDNEIPLPTDMGYAIQSNMIHKIIEYKQNNKFKKSKYSRAELYEKMLPSVVVVAVLKND